ncbi:MEKHLA domain-containing protein [Altererythrobacter sp. KTW20L]|uniref:MEKHLA domain-containing protein n=1 Tax=Altererythrobacter sp. KTW20L TaxID=2942210 RepID=UPI0020BE47A6|nr:MEKHLA domain-containing protein [Altererythrobacter sp. KTW20L]MCL6252292.1 MEKHLA domain-containing protein [Altererythrobacter sp. KTW20L]
MEASAGARLALLGESYLRLTGQSLCTGDVWDAPLAVVAHGTQTPPMFFFANRLALDLFRMTPAQFIGLPSYKSAEPALREERAAMLARLEAHDVVHGYNGVRIAADGTRFRIEDAVIWNLVDEAGVRLGQAAAFGTWTML